MYDFQFEKAMDKAIEEGNLDEIKKLIGDDTEKLQMPIPRGNWLHLAVTYEQMEIVKYLLDAGIDRNVENRDGNVLVTATGIGNVDMIQYLMRNDIELMTTLDKRNPLFVAVCGDNLETFQYLLVLEKEMLTEAEYTALMEMVLSEAGIFAAKNILKFLKADKKEKIKKAQKEQKDRIIQLFIDGAKACFEALPSYYEGEKIYIVSLECEESLSKVYLYVNTVENLQESLENADDDMKDEICYYKYCEDEWNVFDESPEYFAGVGKYIKDEGIQNSDDSVWYKLIVEAINKLRKEKFFETVGLGEILITIYEHDTYSQEEFIKLFKKMNQGKAVDEFIDNMDDFY
ncbi:MAG: ankyrin repeat domain-containing protein [Lachnospiraceae bacterium]|nr:ankyrin repeat domain-containing protein [Lachnospiraceae bacterium]